MKYESSSKTRILCRRRDHYVVRMGVIAIINNEPDMAKWWPKPPTECRPSICSTNTCRILFCWIRACRKRAASKGGEGNYRARHGTARILMLTAFGR